MAPQRANARGPDDTPGGAAMVKRTGPKPRPPAERFWPKVEMTPTCWLWRAAENGGGYGRFAVGGRGVRLVYAHRFAYELLVGPVPVGLVLDHLCRNPACVNPAHLEPVTVAENARRGIWTKAAARSHCKRGHCFDEANTRRYRGRRHCRACSRQRAQVQRQGGHFV